jgi:hypothetical protein
MSATAREAGCLTGALKSAPGQEAIIDVVLVGDHRLVLTGTDKVSESSSIARVTKISQIAIEIKDPHS